MPLSLRRRDQQEITIRHAVTGDLLTIRVYRRSRDPGQLDLCFDDPTRKFVIDRPDRNTRGGSAS